MMMMVYRSIGERQSLVRSIVLLVVVVVVCGQSLGDDHIVGRTELHRADSTYQVYKLISI